MTAALVIQTSFLGDTVLTTPLLSQLAHRGPVDVVVTPTSAALLANHPSVRDIIVYDKRGVDRGVRGLLALAKKLRQARYDSALLAQGSWRSAALALFAGIPQRLGFATSAGRLLYTKRVGYRDDLHHSARLLMLARPNGREPTPEELQPSLYPGDAERSAVDAFLAGARVAPEDVLVAIAPGSVWATKRWPYYDRLAELIGHDARVVIIGGSDDAVLAGEIVAAAPSAVDGTGRFSLLASAELVRRAHVLVTNDSLPLHLGSAMGTPTVAIFGPTVPDFGFGPLAERSVVVGKDALECRPCDRHGPQRCPLGHHKCMKDVEAETVRGAVMGILFRSNKGLR